MNLMSLYTFLFKSGAKKEVSYSIYTIEIRIRKSIYKIFPAIVLETL